MDLKRKKNLEPLKGNKFSILHADSIEQLASDVRIQLGCDESESEKCMSRMIENDKKKYEDFVEQNPDMLLPTNVEANICIEEYGSMGQSGVLNSQTELQTPIGSLEDPSASPLWTEVVRRGKSKTRSRIENKGCDERCILEY
jgi:hypothetical protein